MSTSLRQQRILVAGLHLLTLILLGLQLYVRSLPPTPTPIPGPTDAETLWWGFWPITYLPTWAVTLGTVLLVGSILVFWGSETRDQRPEIKAQLDTLPLAPCPLPLLLALSALLGLAFFIFPIVHTRWGDAFLIAKAIAWPDPAQRLSYSWQAPLDVFLHSQVWLHWHTAMHWKNALSVYRLLSPLAGILYLGVVLALTRHSPLAPPWLTFGLLTSLGLLQLFFGYIENYSFMTVGVLAYLGLGLAVLAGQASLWLAATVLAITHATHPSTVILAPSLLYCAWQLPKISPKRNQSLLVNVLQVMLPMVIVATAVIALMTYGGHGLKALLTTDRPGGSDASFFVPLWKTSSRWQHYTMFSWAHWRDFLNEQMLVAPVVLLGLMWVGVANLWRLGTRDQRLACGTEQSPISGLWSPQITSQLRFLLICTLSYWLFVWVWNPDYGGQRDWDLFSPAVLPATLLLISLLPRVLPTRRYLLAGAMPLIMVQWLHTAAWIYQNTLPWSWPK
ncbi:MAG: hypothetical protein U0350_21870 [Caldilineaceae bacterium]